MPLKDKGYILFNQYRNSKRSNDRIQNITDLSLSL